MGTDNFYNLTKGRTGREIASIKHVCAKVVKTYSVNVNKHLGVQFDKDIPFEEALEKYKELFKKCVDYYLQNKGTETKDMLMAFDTLPKYFKKSYFVRANKEIISKSLLYLFEMVMRGIMEVEGGSKYE